MTLLDLTVKQKTYALTAAFLIVAALILGLVATPLIIQIRQGGLELAQKKQVIDSLFSDWEALENSKKEYQKIQQELTAQPALLPESEAIKFIMFIEEAARTTGNQQDITMSAPVATDDKKSTKPKDIINCQINLKGSFPGLMKFLAYLENAPYYNDIDTIQIQRVGESILSETGVKARAGDINTSLTLTVYQQ